MWILMLMSINLCIVCSMNPSKIVIARWNELEASSTNGHDSNGYCKEVIVPSQGVHKVCVIHGNDVVIWMNDDVLIWNCYLRVNNAMFQDFRLEFKINFGLKSRYPFKAPIIEFITKIEGHPNIDYKTGELLDIMQPLESDNWYGWSPVISMETLLKHIHVLLYHNNSFVNPDKLQESMIRNNPQISKFVEPSKWPKIDQIDDYQHRNRFIDGLQIKLTKIFEKREKRLNDPTIISLKVKIPSFVNNNTILTSIFMEHGFDELTSMYSQLIKFNKTWIISQFDHFYKGYQEMFAFYQLICVHKHDDIPAFDDCDYWIVSKIIIIKNLQTGIKKIESRIDDITSYDNICDIMRNNTIYRNKINISYVDDRIYNAIFCDLINTKILYHSTSITAAQSIKHENYIMNPGDTGMFGAGIYWAETPNIATYKSRHGKSVIIQARVLIEGYYTARDGDNLSVYNLYDTVYAATTAGVSNPEWRVKHWWQVRIIRIIYLDSEHQPAHGVVKS